MLEDWRRLHNPICRGDRLCAAIGMDEYDRIDLGVAGIIIGQCLVGYEADYVGRRFGMAR